MTSSVGREAIGAPLPQIVQDGMIDGTALRTALIDATSAYVRALKDDEAADIVAGGALHKLHLVLAADEVGGLRDAVLDRLRVDLLALAVRVGRSVIGWTSDFYIDDYLILRINFPFEVARNASPTAENPGIGRVSGSVRELATSRRIKDPVYDPKGYHRGYPPAAWAHGPHIDSWAGHSRNGVNIWWAMCDVPAEASMVLYPATAGQPLSCDRRTLYLNGGHLLPVPEYVPLAAGEMLIFDPEMLHGTHLNVTDRTRVAISLRLNPARPTFDPASFYAREFWRRASDIETGMLDTVLHLPREHNLAPALPAVASSAAPSVSVPYRIESGQAIIKPADALSRDGRMLTEVDGQLILVCQNSKGLHAFGALCPHYGLSLADGAVDKQKIHCPGCALAFDLVTGTSACASLRLRTYPVAMQEGSIILTLEQDSAEDTPAELMRLQDDCPGPSDLPSGHQIVDGALAPCPDV